MSLVAPLWLLALLPWLAVVVWMLTGQRERAAVPFLELWRGKVSPLPKARAAMHIPPVSVVLLLLAALVAILAAARPRVGGGMYSETKIVIIIDRGFSMAAAWRGLLDDLEKQISEQFEGAGVERLPIPDTESVSIDTRALIPPAVRRALEDPNVVVFLISDQPPPLADPRLLHVAPAAPARNVGIAQASARTLPTPQVMVRIRNDSTLASAQLNVGTMLRSVELPPAGQEKNYFIDTVSLEKTTRIELVVADDLPADNRVELVRTSTWPRLDAQGELGPPLLRMIETYRTIRPAPPGAPRLAVRSGFDDRYPIPAVFVGPADRPFNGRLQINAHAITSAVDWATLEGQAIQTAAQAPEGWTVLARAGERPVLAVRESPVRGVWVGFESESFARTADFVIFWTNVFDWAGAGDERFVPTGTLALPIPTPPPSNWTGRLDNPPPPLLAGTPVAPHLALAAGLMIFIAALLWGVAKNAW